jgi:hypothetical protein
VFEDSGHWPFADDPERTAAVVIPFLREQVSASHEVIKASAARREAPDFRRAAQPPR